MGKFQWKRCASNAKNKLEANNNENVDSSQENQKFLDRTGPVDQVAEQLSSMEANVNRNRRPTKQRQNDIRKVQLNESIEKETNNNAIPAGNDSSEPKAKRGKLNTDDVQVHSVQKGQDVTAPKQVAADLDFEELDREAPVIPMENQHNGVDLSINANEDDFPSSDEENLVQDSDEEVGSEGQVTPSVISSDAEVSFARRTTNSKLQDIKSASDLEDLVERLVDKRLKEQEKAKTAKTPKRTNNRQGKEMANNLLKSPSDTTLYTPALHKSNATNSVALLNREILPLITQPENIVDKISNFLYQVRGQTSNKDKVSAEGDALPGTSQDNQAPPSDDEEIDCARQLILDAEKFKASVAPPKGITSNQYDVTDLMRVIGDLKDTLDADNDDDFFHITCHVELNLRSKIANGEFVELDRLLPRMRHERINDDRRNDLFKVIMTKEGSFNVPEKDKITNIRKWEQGFRIYAAIFSEANPSRAAEIWQYVHVINTAVSSYHWDNILEYDYTFRQLMAQKPKRSWAKTYSQAWQLCMRNPITNSSAVTGSGQAVKDWRDRCCWKFNRNHCRNASGCDFDHRCTYCGGWGHGYYNCQKRLKHRSGGGFGQNNSDHASGPDKGRDKFHKSSPKPKGFHSTNEK